MDYSTLMEFISKFTKDSIEEPFKSLAKRPCLSPNYNADWIKDGELKEALEDLVTFINQIELKGAKAEVLTEPGTTPLLYVDINPLNSDVEKVLLFYSHIDKIPFGDGWNYDPKDPKCFDNKFYGRGTANGGNAIFAVVTAIKAIQEQNQKHPRIIILIETCKESGSFDLLNYLKSDTLKDISPTLIMCLNAEILSNERINIFSSMRGHFSFDVNVKVTTRGVHSGCFGGLVPDSLMVMNLLIDKIEKINEEERKITIPLLETELTEEQSESADKLIEAIGDELYTMIPYIDELKFLGQDKKEYYINNAYRPAFRVIGYEGIPSIENAASIIRPYSTYRFSFQVPPMLDVNEYSEKVEKELLENTPFHSNVLIDQESYNYIQGKEFKLSQQTKEVLNKKLDDNQIDTLYIGTGESLIYPQYFSEVYRNAEIVVTGAADVHCNFRSINEYLPWGYWMKYIAWLAIVANEYATIPDPVDPDPEDPVDPVDPDPEDPVDPVEPDPEDPVDPVDPEDPVDPVEPENPDVPDPENQDVPSKK